MLDGGCAVGYLLNSSESFDCLMIGFGGGCIVACKITFTVN
jgi:hypothetical protein